MPSTTGTGPLTKSNAETKLAKAAAEVAGGAQKERSQEKETAAAGQQQQQSGGNKTPPEQPEFIKQALIIIEKKVRNLEKRRQKLDEYKTMQRKNETLNEDQLNAVSRYDEVIRTLELSRELEKQFISLANDAMKQQKKQAKKEQTEREEAIKEKIKETQKYLTVLDVFGQENVRNDFLNEQNGAVKITQVELEVLDEFNKIARPTEIGARLDAAATEAADHLVALVDAKGKSISGLVSSATGSPLTFTYSDLKKLFDRVLGATYWTQQQQQQPTQESVDQPADVQLHDQVVNDVHQQVEGQLEHHEQTAAMLNKLALHDEQLQLHQQHVVLEQVSSNDLSDKDKDASPNQLGQQSKTFFTTLNPADMQRNINEFITDDGINFLQDSEIQVQHQQQIQHQQHQQQQAYQQHQHVQQNEQQVQADGLQYQPQLIQQAQQMHPNMQSNNYGAQQQQQYVQMGQDFNDMSKDQGGYRGPRGAGNHQGGGGGGPRGPRPQRYDDRRGPRNGGSGGPPAQQGQGPRNPAGPYNGQRQSGGGGMNGGNGGVPQGSGGGYRQNNYAQNRQGGGGGSGNGGSYRGGNRGGNVPPRQGGYHQQQQPQAV